MSKCIDFETIEVFNNKISNTQRRMAKSKIRLEIGTATRLVNRKKTGNCLKCNKTNGVVKICAASVIEIILHK